jgi:Ino eighty subunit 1
MYVLLFLSYFPFLYPDPYSLPVFPEMKTALRSYHPVPSLQKTDGNVQDAPRIKNCLKAAFLPGEQKSAPPSTPADILARAVRT